MMLSSNHCRQHQCIWQYATHGPVNEELHTRGKVPSQVARLRAAAHDDHAAVAHAHAVIAHQQRHLAHARMRPRRHLLLRSTAGSLCLCLGRWGV